MQKRWTIEDEDLIGKYSDEAIALATGRTRASISNRKTKIKKSRDDFDVCVCRQCGKEFIVLDKSAWVYTRYDNSNHKRYFCTWGCMRAHDRGKQRKKADIG